MIDLGLVALVVIIALASSRAFSESSRRNLVRWFCWLPATALALEYMASTVLAASLGYAGILVPLATCAVSFSLAVVGTKVLLAGRARSEPDRVLLFATILAALPAAFLLAELIREIV